MKKVVLLIIAFIVIYSCKKREDSISWNIDVLAPVVYGELSTSDILPDSILVNNPDSTISINMDLNLYSLDLDSLVAIPDTFLRDTFAFSSLFPPILLPLSISPGQMLVPSEAEENVLNLGTVELTYIEVKSGRIDYILESTIQGKVIYEYQIPVALDGNGVLFSQLVYVPAATSNNAIVTGSFDLSGYSIDLSGAAGNSFNTIQTNVNVKVDPTNGGDVTVSDQDTIYIENSLKTIKIDYAKGYFGDDSFDIGPETEKIATYNNLMSGNIDINQIDVELELINGIGVDANLVFNNFSAFNTVNSLSLNHSIIGNNTNINRAYKIGNTIYPYTHTILLNNSNSNIDKLFELFPDSISYELSLQLNPLGNMSAHNDFISSESPMELNMSLSLPLSLIADNLTLVDTINMDISDTTSIKSAQLNFHLENGFPLEAQLYFSLLDQNDMVVGHVFSPNLIPSAIVDGSGVVVSPSLSTHYLTLDAKDLKTFIVNKKFILKIIYNTSGATHVDIYDYHKLKYTITADFNYSVEIE